MHVPIGVAFLLVCVWGLKLALRSAPFRFPAAVLTMAAFFLLLLALDWLSLVFPGTKASDPEQDPVTTVSDEKEGDNKTAPLTPAEAPRKRFVDPLMALLAPPCEFALRNMSVMFTPSFILIPARETLPSREIGLLAGWFTATQVAAFVFPVLMCWAVDWVFKNVKLGSMRSQLHKLGIASNGNGSSPSSGTAGGSGGASIVASRKGSTATLAGMEFEKRISYTGGQRLGSIATGLSGLTAVIVAPVSHINMSDEQDARNIDPDVRSHIESVAMENARQQGDPFMRRSRSKAASSVHRGRPSPLIRSNVSNFQHAAPMATSHSHNSHVMSRSRSRSRDRGGADHVHERDRTDSRERGRHGHHYERPGSGGSARSFDSAVPTPLTGTTGTASVASPSASPGWSHWNFPSPLKSAGRSFSTDVYPSTSEAAATAFEASPPPTAASGADPTYQFMHRSVTFDASVNSTSRGTDPQPVVRGRSAFSPQLLMPSRLRNVTSTARSSEDGHRSEQGTETDPSSPTAAEMERNTRSNSAVTLTNGQLPGLSISGVGVGASGGENQRDDAQKTQVTVSDDDEKDGQQAPPGAHADGDEQSEEQEPNAVERLADWISDLITPSIYFIAFVVGIPLYYVLDFALLLFLAINILTFIAAITIVPPQVRRYLHPILSCSISSVLIFWALGAIKGLSIKETLSQYSQDNARYTDLWDPSGYMGPPPGAGDVLFSTLDAGIVALAVPMYRYRRDLRDNFGRMVSVLTPCAALSLFVWPTLARVIGMDPLRSLAFSARFMSTPLAIEMANNVGADESITIILVVLTGIIAAILKEPFFKMMRVPESDFATWGITMGSTAGAIGASSLISKPRTMAIASLSFVLFGAILLICAAIPPIVSAMHSLAGNPAQFLKSVA